MIKNIVFDLGSVLLKGNPEDILKSLSIDESDKKIILDNYFGNFLQVNLGLVSLEKLLDDCEISDKVSNDIKYKLSHYYLYRDFNQELLKLIDVLKKNNYNIYILSNNSREVLNYLLSKDEFKYVDGWIVSCSYNTVKSEKKLYEYLFSKYKLDPKECYFIDDKLENIKIGIEYGMLGFVFNENVDDLICDLKDKKVICD